MPSRAEEIAKMLAQEPGDAFLRYLLALEYAKAGDIARACTEAGLIISNSPDYLPVYYQYASWLCETGNRAKAKDILEQGLQVALSQKEMKTASEIRSFLDQLMADEE